jgi:mono/diheme cytochrome c family protein
MTWVLDLLTWTDAQIKRTVRRGLMMIMHRMLLCHIQIAIAFCVMTSVTHSQTPANIARGQAIADQACAGCHAIDGQKGGTIQGIEVPSFRAIANRPNRTRERLKAFITTPQHPMPGIPLGLSDIDDVVAYILSLK